MVNTGFMRRQNPDSTADVICLCCFRTVAFSQAQYDLASAENDHICNPFDDLVLLQSGCLQHEQEKTALPLKECRAV
jgi:hypothetical protein